MLLKWPSLRCQCSTKLGIVYVARFVQSRHVAVAAIQFAMGLVMGQEIVEVFERAMTFRYPANVQSFIRVACQMPLKCRSTPELAVTFRMCAFELPLGYAIWRFLGGPA